MADLGWAKYFFLKFGWRVGLILIFLPQPLVFHKTDFLGVKFDNALINPLVILILNIISRFEGFAMKHMPAIVATLVEGYGHVIEAMDCTAAA